MLSALSGAIVWAAEPKVYSLDVDYEFRQDSNLLYLTGVMQEGAILVLMPGNAARREIHEECGLTDLDLVRELGSFTRLGFRRGLPDAARRQVGAAQVEDVEVA